MRLCKAVNVAVQTENAYQLQSIVLLEPPFPADHQELIASLQRKYPENDPRSEARLKSLVKEVVTETSESQDAEGRPISEWTAMVTFLVGWMTTLRDMDVDNLVLLFQQLSDILQWVHRQTNRKQRLLVADADLSADEGTAHWHIQPKVYSCYPRLSAMRMYLHVWLSVWIRSQSSSLI